MNTLVFDIETVPDIESGKKLYNLEGLKAEDAAELMFSHRRQETDGKSDFLRHYLHKVVAISLVLKTKDKLSVWSLGDADADEKEIEFIGGLYRLDHNLTAHKMVSNIACSNGLAWSPDSTVMYFSDSHSGEVVQYDFDPETGNIDNKRRFIDMSALGGVADGATVDSDGCYWVTIPITGKVCRFDPNGVLMQTIHLPTDCPTCCEFGGENLDTLFVTSATLNRPEKHFVNQNNPGGLFAIEGTGATGLSLCPFKG